MPRLLDTFARWRDRDTADRDLTPPNRKKLRRVKRLRARRASR